MKLIILSLLLAILALLFGCGPSKVVCRKIEIVGGCGSGGKCGVKFDDGTFDTTYHPVVGETRCIRVWEEDK